MAKEIDSILNGDCKGNCCRGMPCFRCGERFCTRYGKGVQLDMNRKMGVCEKCWKYYNDQGAFGKRKILKLAKQEKLANDKLNNNNNNKSCLRRLYYYIFSCFIE